jgi:hypothetical protein
MYSPSRVHARLSPIRNKIHPVGFNEEASPIHLQRWAQLPSTAPRSLMARGVSFRTSRPVQFWV